MHWIFCFLAIIQHGICYTQWIQFSGAYSECLSQHIGMDIHRRLSPNYTWLSSRCTSFRALVKHQQKRKPCCKRMETFCNTNSLSQIYGKVFGFGLSEHTKLTIWPYLGQRYKLEMRTGKSEREKMYRSHCLFIHIETTRLFIVSIWWWYWLRLFYLLHPNVIVCPFAIYNLFEISFVNRILWSLQFDKNNNNDDISMWTCNFFLYIQYI